jgi:hypothetical protein
MLALMKSIFKDRLVLPKQDGFEGWYSRGYFPHFDGQGMTQHVCFHLCDSLPQGFLSQLRAEWNASVAVGAGSASADPNYEWRKRIHQFLDSGYGSCALRDEKLAKVIEDSLLHFDGNRYSLHAWVRYAESRSYTLYTTRWS